MYDLEYLRGKQTVIMYPGVSTGDMNTHMAGVMTVCRQVFISRENVLLLYERHILEEMQ